MPDTIFPNIHTAWLLGGKDEGKYHADCSDAKQAKGGILTPLMESFKPLTMDAKMDEEWFNIMKDSKTSGRPQK